ncbi:hypothetical protein B0H16DRAFT_489637 [Mycena metata]|uniref:Uncharacterized protein n=1 Tax=Mycena metata TaxID=1033252 RepID=A0AAD7KDB3_9AGAR|nr:hypothetical protein B0H16DRAFT_489637 [Mycena metata]
MSVQVKQAAQMPNFVWCLRPLYTHHLLTKARMNNGKKRKRDLTVPRIVYLAPNHRTLSRFAKLLQESSLDDIKETVRDRLELSSTSDFTLFYDNGTPLANEDDFDAFDVYAHSASPPIIVEIHVPSLAPSSDADVVEERTVSAPVDETGETDETVPARKKRKVDADASAKSTASAPKSKATPVSSAPKSKAKPISSAPEPKKQKQKSDATVVDTESISTALSASKGGASTAPKMPGGKEPKKRRKQDDAVAGPSAVSADAPGANPVPEPPQERPRKKRKKAAEKDSVDTPAQPAAEVPALAPATEAPEPLGDEGEQPKAKSKKTPAGSTEKTPAKSTPSTSKKKSKKTDDAEDGAAPNRRKSVTFTVPDQLPAATPPPAGDGTAQSVPAVASRQKSQDPEKGLILPNAR